MQILTSLCCGKFDIILTIKDIHLTGHWLRVNTEKNVEPHIKKTIKKEKKSRKKNAYL